MCYRQKEERARMERLRKRTEAEGYMECYPGYAEAMASADAGGMRNTLLYLVFFLINSNFIIIIPCICISCVAADVSDDDEAPDYSKMDSGRKGPVNRWDFETEEEYSEYMSKREALPK